MIYLTTMILAFGLVLIGIEKKELSEMSVSTSNTTYDLSIPVASRVKLQLSKFFKGGLKIGQEEMPTARKYEAVQSNSIEKVDSDFNIDSNEQVESIKKSLEDEKTEEYDQSAEKELSLPEKIFDKIFYSIVKLMTAMDLTDPSTMVRVELPVIDIPLNGLASLSAKGEVLQNEKVLNLQNKSLSENFNEQQPNELNKSGQVYIDNHVEIIQVEEDILVDKENNEDEVVKESVVDEKDLQTEEMITEQVIYTAKAVKPIVSTSEDTIKRTSDDITGKTGFLESLDEFGNTPKVAIIHTHNSEAYKASQGVDYVWGENSGVVGVGAVLADELYNSYGISTIHSTRIHDYPDWNKSYVNSLETMENLVEKYSSIETLIDLHRDSVNSPSLNVATVNGEKVARVMIVVTDDTCGLYHPDWNKNYQFALKLNEQLNKMYPGFSRGVSLKTNSRLNQHVHNQAIIIEVGGTGNTRQEADRSAKLIAKALSVILQQ